MSECVHTWDKLSISIGNRTVFPDGSFERWPDIARCNECGATWDLDSMEVAAASACMDGHFLCARLKYEAAK